MSATNLCCLRGVLIERSEVRYTPAGVPIVTGLMTHQSEQQEAGSVRRIDCEIPVLAAGAQVDLLLQITLGSVCQFSGFLNRKTRNSPRLVLHVTDVQMDVQGGDPPLA